MFFMRRKQKIEDTLFGSMTLVDDEIQYYGTCYFMPLEKEIEINVFSQSGGPTDNQRSLYREIEQRYFNCIEKLPQLIEDEFHKEQNGFLIRNFSKEFELIGINIPPLADNKVSWELEYTTAHELDGWITVHFIEWEPIKVSFDQ